MTTQKRIDIAHLWRAVDRLAADLAEERARVVDLEQRVLLLERGGAGVERIPAAQAARRLGVAPVTIRRLLTEGQLDGLAIQLGDGARRSWTVTVESVERFEAIHVPPGAPVASDAPNSGQGREGRRG